MQHIAEFITASRANRFTLRVFGLFLLVTSALIPTGIHRKWMGWDGWWIYPIVATIALIGFWQSTFTAIHGWRYLALPYFFIFLHDAWALFLPPKPNGKSRNE